MIIPQASAYSVLAIVGILLTAAMWGWMTACDGRHDRRLTIIYFCGLVGAFLGAKISFLLAEGWHFRHDWLALVSGRSITGGLLGGYVAVEIGKKLLKYTRATGDWFAVLVPLAMALGRVGCLLQGCCPGIACSEAHWWTVHDSAGQPRWPAAMAELLFNVLFLGWAVVATRRHWLPGNRFHVYMIAYGAFRFVHEFLRDDQKIAGSLTGYHFLALAIFVVGIWRFAQRQAKTAGAKPGTAVIDIEPT